MNRMASIRKLVFGLGVAATLGFGASQAFATPQRAAEGQYCYPECYKQCGPAMGTMLRDGMCICCSD